jgi:hypothetical protein
MDVSLECNNGTLIHGSPDLSWAPDGIDFPTHASSYVNLNIPSTSPAASPGTFTWTANIRPQGNPQNSQGRIWNFRSVNKDGHIIDDGTFEALIFIGGSVRTATSTDAIADNEDGHVALVYDGANLYWVINGVKQTPVAATGAVTLSSHVSTVGASGGVNFAFNGIIKDVGIWNRGLALSEVQQLYEDQYALIRQPNRTYFFDINGGGAPPVGPPTTPYYDLFLQQGAA